MKKSKLSLLFATLTMLLSSCGMFGGTGGGNDIFSPLPQDEGFFLLGENNIGEYQNSLKIYYQNGEYRNRMRTVYPKDLPNDIKNNFGRNAQVLRSYRIENIGFGINQSSYNVNCYINGQYYNGNGSLGFKIAKGTYISNEDSWYVDKMIPGFNEQNRRHVSLTPDSLFVFDKETMVEKDLGKLGYLREDASAVCLAGTGYYDVYIVEFQQSSSVQYGLGIVKTRNYNGGYGDLHLIGTGDGNDSEVPPSGYDWHISNKDELTRPWAPNDEPREILIESTPSANLSSLVLRGDAQIYLSNNHVVYLDRATLYPTGIGSVRVEVYFDGQMDYVDITVEYSNPEIMNVRTAQTAVNSYGIEKYVSVKMRVMEVFSDGFIGGENGYFIYVETNIEVNVGDSLCVDGLLYKNEVVQLTRIKNVNQISYLSSPISCNVYFDNMDIDSWHLYHNSSNRFIEPITGYARVVYANSQLCFEYSSDGTSFDGSFRHGYMLNHLNDANFIYVENLYGIYRFDGYLIGKDNQLNYVAVTSYETIVEGTGSVEPDVVTVNSLDEAITYSANEMAQKFYMEDVVVTGWRTGTNGGQYGNFNITDGETSILVYGATSDESAMVWHEETLSYAYLNPKNFLLNELTASIVIGSKIDILFLITSYASVKQLNAVVRDVDNSDIQEVEEPSVVELNNFNEIGANPKLASLKYVIDDVSVSRWFGLYENATTRGTYYLIDSEGTEVNVYASSANSSITFNGMSYDFQSETDFLTNEMTKTIDINSKLTIEFVITAVKGTIYQLRGKVLAVDNSYYDEPHNIMEPTPIETDNVNDLYTYGAPYARVGFNFHEFTIARISSLDISGTIDFTDKYGNTIYSYRNVADKESAITWDTQRGLYVWSDTNAVSLSENPLTQNLTVGSVVSGFCFVQPHVNTFEIFVVITEVHSL